jgi:UDP-N-acetylmuramoyl-L-alanyl-D-glutamate--2,6-diaminopimelate ligase
MKSNFLFRILKKIVPKQLKKNPFLRKGLALIANIFYGFPGKKLSIIGVTGTTGKTTTAFMIKKILEGGGIKTGLIGTAGYFLKDQVIPVIGQGPGTTPDPFYLNYLLRKMVNQGITTVVIEVSSFGLMYWRIYGLPFKVAVLTNLAYNHHVKLHGSMDNYVKEKLKLFQILSSQAVAVLPQDSEYFELFKQNTKAKIIPFSLNQNEKWKLKLKIPGAFNILNALAAINAVTDFNLSQEQIKNSLENILSIPGRVEAINSSAPFKIIIDKANTPLAFQNIIDYIKNDLRPNRTIAVYGTFDESPIEEREQLAQLATDFFDLTIITEDDPKNEAPDQGIKDFLQFAQKNQIPTNKYLTIVNRREAIRTAISRAAKNDLVIILGRGNEKLMYYKDKTIPFDDREVVREILKEFHYLS